MNIHSNIVTINQHLKAAGAKLIIVSKNQQINLIQEAYDLGYRNFAENKVQNLLQRQEFLPKDIRWHMIGHLQVNKVKYIAPFIHLIHSVDSSKLASVINKEAEKNNRTIDILLQINISKESNKHGFSYEELSLLLEKGLFKNFSNIKITGLMGMASNTINQDIINEQFSNLNIYFKKLKKTYFKGDQSFKELSIGMSSDYLLALKNGSTIVRLGSIIFNRDYASGLN